MNKSLLSLPSLTVVLIVLSTTAGFSQEVSISLADNGSLSATTIQLIAIITLLSLAPGIVIMITCFPFLVTVLSILRQAIGLQQAPPNMLLVSLALFLTYFVMEPVFMTAWTNGIEPFMQEEMEAEAAFFATLAPFREFMAARLDPEVFAEITALRDDTRGVPISPEAPLSALIPSFLLSELSRAFQVGFLIFMPFLIIDLVVAAVLMSMGMMMVPPAIVSLPFKLAFFVFADGWALIASSLVRSYY